MLVNSSKGLNIGTLINVQNAILDTSSNILFISFICELILMSFFKKSHLVRQHIEIMKYQKYFQTELASRKYNL